MKSKFTIFLIIFILQFELISQTGKLSVFVTDICDIPSGESFKTSLYLNSGLNKVFLKQTINQPAVFENLVNSYQYTIIVEPVSLKKPQLSLKDLSLVRLGIIGEKELSDFALLTGNVNDGIVTTESHVVMIKNSLLYDSLHFQNQYLFTIDQSPNITQTNTSEFVLNGITTEHDEVRIITTKRGMVSHAVTDYCDGKCPDIVGKSASLIFENQEIKKGEEITFPLYFDDQEAYQAAFFTFSSVNAKIVDIQKYPNTDFVSAGADKYRFLWISNMISGNDGDTLAYISLIPEKDGVLSDFIRIENSKSEAIIYTDSCVVSYNKVVLEPIINIADCLISLPLNITIPDCSPQYYVGEPLIHKLCKNHFSVTFTDQILVECEKKLRIWTMLNWLTGKVDQHVQIIFIREDFKHVCNQDMVIDFDDTYKFVTARSMVENPFSHHSYSFSSVDVADTIRLMKLEQPLQEYLHIYDLTDTLFCITKVTKNLSLNILPQIIVNENNGYKVEAISFIPSGTQLPAGISNLRISHDGGSYLISIFFDASYSGQTIPLTLRYTQNGVNKIYGMVNAVLLQKPEIPPLKFIAYNDYLTEGMSYEMEIYSPNFNNIIGLQFELKFANISFQGSGSGHLNINHVHYNYFAPTDILRLVWIQQNVEPISVDQSVKLFSFIFTPQKSGYLSEFVKVETSSLMPEAIYNNLTVSNNILLDFDFPNRPTSTEETNISPISVFPNPAAISSAINISWKDGHQPESVIVKDINGRVVLQKEIFGAADRVISMNLNDAINSGVYFLTFKTKTRSATKKLMIVR
ncbi:MAG: T9SS type A sorting domain-containing protein [Saprospiraceae bacterium]|nr:T9SS type A sorting domain-containing protein [Saprospiraceae bacterium]